jgi:hypothetical protein
MNTPLNAIISDEKITFVANGKSYTLKRGTPSAADVIAAIEQGDANRAIAGANDANGL